MIPPQTFRAGKAAKRFGRYAALERLIRGVGRIRAARPMRIIRLRDVIRDRRPPGSTRHGP